VSVRPLTITLLPSCCCPSRSSLCSCFQRGHCKPKYGSVRGSRFHSRDSVIPSAIPVFPYGLEPVLVARSHQRGFSRATGYLEQVPGTPAPPTSTCMNRLGCSSGVESSRRYWLNWFRVYVPILLFGPFASGDGRILYFWATIGACFRLRGASAKSALISSKCSCGALGSA
jgi:hypothetical protein